MRRMYKVLIVDDEPLVLKGIENFINWEAYGVTVCGTASNGLEAYKLIEQEEPDIVITDIKMPYMSGIELIEKVSPKYPDIEFIILSAYAEFEHAKKAMRYGVMYYLLKPTGVYEIEDIIKGIVGSIEKEPEAEDEDGPSVDEELKARYKKQMEITFDYIENHLDNPNVNLGFISRELVYMNADHFGRVFKKITGKFYTQYVMEKRMERAAKLLAETDLMIYEIAEMVGFGENATYFGQVFKRYFSETPQQYRKNKGNKKG